MTAQFEYLPKGTEGENYETHYKIRIYAKDNKGFWQETCEPIEITPKTLPGAKVKAHTTARSLGLVPHTRQWLSKMTFVHRPRAHRFYQDETGTLKMVVIGDETIVRTGGKPKLVTEIVNTEKEVVAYLGLWKTYARMLNPPFPVRPIGDPTAETDFHSDLNAPDLRKAITKATEPQAEIDFTITTEDLDKFIKACESEPCERRTLQMGCSHKGKFQWYLTNEVWRAGCDASYIGLKPYSETVTKEQEQGADGNPESQSNRI